MTLIIELWAPCRGGGRPHTLKSANQCPAPNPAGRFAVPATPKAGRRAGRALRRPDRPPGARRDVTSPSARHGLNWNSLLDLDSRTRLFKLLLELRRLVLVDTFLDALGRALDQVLGLLEAETGDRAHFLDDVDLFLTCRGQDDVELGLLGRRGRRCCTDRHGSRRRDAPLLLKLLRQLGRLDDGQRRKIIYQSVKISHVGTPGNFTRVSDVSRLAPVSRGHRARGRSGSPAPAARRRYASPGSAAGRGSCPGAHRVTARLRGT